MAADHALQKLRETLDQPLPEVLGAFRDARHMARRELRKRDQRDGDGPGDEHGVGDGKAKRAGDLDGGLWQAVLRVVRRRKIGLRRNGFRCGHRVVAPAHKDGGSAQRGDRSFDLRMLHGVWLAPDLPKRSSGSCSLFAKTMPRQHGLQTQLESTFDCQEFRGNSQSCVFQESSNKGRYSVLRSVLSPRLAALFFSYCLGVPGRFGWTSSFVCAVQSFSFSRSSSSSCFLLWAELFLSLVQMRVCAHAVYNHRLTHSRRR